MTINEIIKKKKKNISETHWLDSYVYADSFGDEKQKQK